MTPTAPPPLSTRVWVFVDRNPVALTEPGWPIYEGVVRGHHEGKVLVDVPALGGQDPYPPQDVYLSRAAALLPLLESFLETRRRVLRGMTDRVTRAEGEIASIEVQISAARIELATAPGSEPPAEPRDSAAPSPSHQGKRGRSARAKVARKTKTK